MKRVFLWLLLSTVCAFLPAAFAHATSGSVVIAQVQAGAVTGEPAAAAQELVTLYNNSESDVDITNWCLTNKAALTIICMRPTQPGQAFWLSARGFMIVASTNFAAAHPDVTPDSVFEPLTSQSGSITGSGDTLTLVDASQKEIDNVQWITTLPGGSVWQRQANLDDSRVLLDADVVIDSTKTTDFVKQLGLVVPASGLYDVVTVSDQCPNSEGQQMTAPIGALRDDTGDCVTDVCPALDGVQTDVPPGYSVTMSGDCSPEPIALQLTELLPNVSGSDDGREFIELYNPTDQTADLANYQLVIGANGDKTVAFPAGATIGAGQYRVFYNSELAFSLVNTTGKVVLVGPSAEVLSQTDIYTNPADDMAWALIDGRWQYTDRPTAGEANQALLLPDTPVVTANTLQPCAPNQYRSEETNRCRLLVTVASSVTPCKEGQYRSEETNRCRSIASLTASVVKPCADDQFRNPATGRCKAIASSDDAVLTDCGEGRERNPDTHRCRNVASTAIPAAAFAVEPINSTGKTFVGWWALGGVTVLGAGYAIWEWRRELVSGLRKFASFFTFNK